MLLSLQASQDAGAILVNPVSYIRNFQFSEFSMGFSLTAMPQEIQRLLSLRPYREKVMFCGKFYFSPNAKEKWMAFPGIMQKPSGGRRKGMEKKGHTWSHEHGGWEAWYATWLSPSSRGLLKFAKQTSFLSTSTLSNKWSLNVNQVCKNINLLGELTLGRRKQPNIFVFNIYLSLLNLLCLTSAWLLTHLQLARAELVQECVDTFHFCFFCWTQLTFFLFYF